LCRLFRDNPHLAEYLRDKLPTDEEKREVLLSTEADGKTIAEWEREMLAQYALELDERIMKLGDEATDVSILSFGDGKADEKVGPEGDHTFACGCDFSQKNQASGTVEVCEEHKHGNKQAGMAFSYDEEEGK